MPHPTQLRKALVLLTSIPEEDATQLLAQCSPQHLAALAEAAADADGPRAHEQQDLAEDLTSRKHLAWVPAVHEADTIDGELAVGEETEAARGKVGGEVTPDNGDVWPFPDSCDGSIAACDALRKLHLDDPSRLRSLLAQERPQVVAVVLAYLAPQVAARVLHDLPTEVQVAASVRVAQLEQVDAESVAAIADVLSERLKRRTTPLPTEVGGPRHLARILQETDRATERALLENLTHEDRQLAGDLQQHLLLLRRLRRRRDPGRDPGREPAADAA